MPSKAETKSIKAEIRELRKSVTRRRKEILRVIAIDRKKAREATKAVESNERILGLFEREINQRIAILEGRLSV